MRSLLVILIVTVVAGAAGPRASDLQTHDANADLQRALETITADELLAHITTLASDEYEGRAPGTRGEQLTVEYLTARFRAAGLQPGNPDGTYVQKVPVAAYIAQPVFSIATGTETRRLGYPDEYVARSRWMVPEVRVEKSPMVFVGFGIDAPGFGWNDYDGIDVRGRTLLMLEGEPALRATATYYGTRQYKLDAAAAKGAAAVFFVHDPKSSGATFEQLKARSLGEALERVPDDPAGRPKVDGYLSASAFERIAADAGRDAATLRRLAAIRGFTPVPLDATADLGVTTRLRTFDSHNVVARLEGSDSQLKDEYVIYSAHWDHLGRNAALAGDQIHNGAIDNAAGVAQLLEIAQGFAALARAPRRSILFLATTGEETGFLGSMQYTEHPLFPLAGAVANINLDAGNVWGRTSDVVNMAYGLTSLDGVLAAAARRQHRTFVDTPFAGGRYVFLSDQFMFARAGIPSAFPAAGETYIGRPAGFGERRWSEYGKRYHTVSDEIEADWDLSGAAEDARWLLDAGYQVAQDDAAPTWNSGAEFRRPAARPGDGVQQPLLGGGRGIDHVTLLTRDVTAAATRFADDFGFTVAPARKLDFGFEAALIYFPDRTYIELYGIHDRKVVAESSEAFALQAPEGVTWVTLDVGSASRTADVLRKLGKPVFGPFKLPDESNWRYQLTGPEQPFLPGGRIFFIEYNRAASDRFRADNRALVEAREAHANGAEGLRSVWVTVDDLDAAAKAYAAAGLAAGPEVELTAMSSRAREIRTPGGTILLVRRAQEPGVAPATGEDAFSGLSIKVAGIDAVRSRVLKQRGVDLRPYAGLYGRSVLIPASLAYGTAIECFESSAPGGPVAAPAAGPSRAPARRRPRR